MRADLRAPDMPPAGVIRDDPIGIGPRRRCDGTILYIPMLATGFHGRPK
ncbi:MAG: hypothetical protein KGO48_18735 [Alphaproteobacteria bacterium]|nr:hypothetical protein [Alphaproteobacteria bacterium]